MHLFRSNLFNWMAIFAVSVLPFTAISSNAEYIVPRLTSVDGDIQGHSHIVVEMSIVRHTHSQESLTVPSTGLPPFQVSNFTILDQNASMLIGATISLSAETSDCSFQVAAATLISDTMYPCGTFMIGYPHSGHIVVTGYVSINK